MDMAVDAARQHQATGGIDLARSSFDLIGQSGDAAVTDADIGPEFVARGDDGAAADRQVKGH